MENKLEKLFKYLQNGFEYFFELTLISGPVSFSAALLLLFINIWLALVIGVIANVVFIRRVIKQSKNLEVSKEIPRMSLFEIIIGSVALFIIDFFIVIYTYAWFISK